MTDRTSGIDPADVEQVRACSRRPRAASRRLALLSRADKDAALRTLADALDATTDEIVAASASSTSPWPRKRHAAEPSRC